MVQTTETVKIRGAEGHPGGAPHGNSEQTGGGKGAARERALPPVSRYWSERLLPLPEQKKRSLPARRKADPVGGSRQAVSWLDIWYPSFCGAVISAFLCVFVLSPSFPPLVPETAAEEEAVPVEDVVLERTEPESLPSEPAPLSLAEAERPDLIKEDWEDLRSRDGVLAFFEELSGSEYLAFSVLVNAENFNIPPAIAFALCWEESRFNSNAVNTSNRDQSIDRGLFQLNNRTFPSLSEEQYFDTWISAYYGLGHLRFCLDEGGSMVTALAMYNAGTVRVRAGGGGTPRRTLDYISRILDTAHIIESLYLEREPVISEEPEPLLPVIAEEEPAPAPRLARLVPILRQGR